MATKVVNGVVVEMSQSELDSFNESRQDCCVCVDGVCSFNASMAIDELLGLINDRRYELESGGVVYTHTTAKTYQTGPIPDRPEIGYERDYQGLVVAGLGSQLKALDDTTDTFSASQVAELWERVVYLASAINTSAMTLKADAEDVTTMAEYNTVKAKIEGDADWPTVPYPEA